MHQTHASGQPFEGDDADDNDGVPAQASASSDAIDDLLDEIDGSLQVNAEQFVRSFVQKGGQ
ncbi:MAG: ubiquitin-like protein Pup [Demequina sp.]